MDTSLRPMSTSQVLDRTFFLYRKNFALFVGIALVTPTLTLISRLIQLAVFGMPVNPGQMGADPAASAAMFQQFFTRIAVSGLIGLVIYMVGYAITTGATVQAVSMLHLGRTTTISESYARVRPIWGRLLWLLVRVFLIAMGPIVLGYVLIALAGLGIAMAGKSNAGLMVGLGLFILVVFVGIAVAAVWSVRAYCRYALAVPACTVEDLPVKFALIRSKFLTKNSLGRVFVVYFLTAVISIAVTLLLQTPTYLTPGAFSLRGGLHLSPALLAWTYTSEFIGQLFAGPIGAIAMALVYYDERVRKEAFDLQLMMEAMKTPGSAQAASV